MSNVFSDSLSWNLKVLFLVPSAQDFTTRIVNLVSFWWEFCAQGFGVLVFEMPITAHLAVKGGERGRRRRSGSYTPI